MPEDARLVHSPHANANAVHSIDCIRSIWMHQWTTVRAEAICARVATMQNMTSSKAKQQPRTEPICLAGHYIQLMQRLTLKQVLL
jgi:hypothetical protein